MRALRDDFLCFGWISNRVFRPRRTVRKAAMLPLVVVVIPPVLQHDAHFLHLVKQLTVWELRPQVRVEAFHMNVLPWWAGCDVIRADLRSGQPGLHLLRQEFSRREGPWLRGCSTALVFYDTFDAAGPHGMKRRPSQPGGDWDYAVLFLCIQRVMFRMTT